LYRSFEVVGGRAVSGCPRIVAVVPPAAGALLVSDDANGTIFRIAPERSEHRPTNKDRG
jgi:glucose/arabinose dehydrogenase